MEISPDSPGQQPDMVLPRFPQPILTPNTAPLSRMCWEVQCGQGSGMAHRAMGGGEGWAEGVSEQAF